MESSFIVRSQLRYTQSGDRELHSVTSMKTMKESHQGKREETERERDIDGSKSWFYHLLDG